MKSIPITMKSMRRSQRSLFVLCYYFVVVLALLVVEQSAAFSVLPTSLFSETNTVTTVATSAGYNDMDITTAKSTLSAVQQKQQQGEEATSTLLSPLEIKQRVFQNDQRPIVLFDGVCNMCNGAVNTAIDWDPDGQLRFAALQSNVGQALLQVNGRKANDISSIVLVNQKGAYIKSDAILKITQALSPVPLLPLQPVAQLGMWLVPQVLRDVLYDTVADNRYQILGKRDECRFDADGEFTDRFVDDQLAFGTKK